MAEKYYPYLCKKCLHIFGVQPHIRSRLSKTESEMLWSSKYAAIWRILCITIELSP